MIDPNDNFVILKSKRLGNHDKAEYLVLCHLPDNQATPWVTWRTNDSAASNDRYAGKYFFDQPSAEDSFNERVW